MLNIQRLEQELDQEGHMADNLVSAMKPKLRDRYVELKNQNTDYQIALEKMNQELDTLNSRKIMLEDEVAISALKREALTLYENLRDLELKRDELVDESSNRGTPAEERERLLAQVSDDFYHFANKTKKNFIQKIGNLALKIGIPDVFEKKLHTESEIIISSKLQKGH